MNTVKNKKSSHSMTDQAVGGAFWSTIISLSQRLGGLVFTVILARFLMPAGFGLYNLVISIAFIFAMFSQEGIHKTLIRYISEARKDKNKAKETAYFRYIVKLKLIILIIISAALVMIAYPLAFYFFKKPIMFVPLLLSSVYIFIISLEQFFTSLFFAIKNVKYSSFAEIVNQTSRIIITLLVFLIIYKNPSTIHAFISLIISAAVTLLFVGYSAYKKATHLFLQKDKLQKKDRKRVFIFSNYLVIASISVFFFGNVDIIMLGWLIPDLTYVGLYKSAFILMASIAGLLSFTQVILPIFIQVKNEKLEFVYNKLFRYHMLIAIPAAFGAGFLGSYFLVLFYGYDYIGGTIPLYFLAALIVLSIQAGLYTELFSAKEKPKDYFNILIIAIVLNIILNFILIIFLSKYSLTLAITGAAIATLISWVFYTMGLNWLVKKKLGIKTNFRLAIKPLIASIIMVVVLYVVKGAFGDINPLKGAILVSLGILVYFMSLFTLKGIKKEDYNVIKVTYKKALENIIKFKLR